ncbi:MAG: hypothetical protein E7052_09855 [Lentisphaerae bacterium]|nr:hypothetical protein [Lentisphaerota bacterium]
MKKIDLNSPVEFFRGVYPSGKRMNKALLDFYSTDEVYIVRANCASSVEIVMQTDAVTLEVFVKFGKAAREIYTTDVKVNGEFFVLSGAGKHILPLPAGSKQVVVYLPHLAVLDDFYLAVNDDARIEAVADERPKLLICGDSILQGMTCSRPSLASVVLAAEALDMQLFNTSLGGAIMRSLPVRETLTLGGAGDVAVVGFGINDVGRTPLELFRERTRRVLGYLSEFAGRSFIITPIPTQLSLEEKRPIYSQIIIDEQKNFPSVNLINGPDFFTASDEVLIDCLHPNDQGMHLYAQGLIKAIAGN